ncbi:hypothetical protein [Halanaerobaculum tunisiense]
MGSNLQKENKLDHSPSMQGGINNEQNNYYISEQAEEDLGIIKDIFEYILNNKKEKEFKDGEFVDIIKKIKLNFNDFEQEDVYEYLKNAYEYIELIDEVFTNFNPSDQKDVHGDIRDRYIRLRRKKDKTFDILLNLFDQYTPNSKESNPKYKRIARAIVLFFFEDCTWGEKIEEEKYF